MSREEMKFELVALSKVEVSGVEYAPGEPFFVSNAQSARWLISIKAARSASTVEEGTAVGSVAEAPSVQNDTPTSGEPGTSDGQASSEKARKGRGGKSA